MGLKGSIFHSVLNRARLLCYSLSRSHSKYTTLWFHMQIRSNASLLTRFCQTRTSSRTNPTLTFRRWWKARKPTNEQNYEKQYLMRRNIWLERRFEKSWRREKVFVSLRLGFIMIVTSGNAEANMLLGRRNNKKTRKDSKRLPSAPGIHQRDQRSSGILSMRSALRHQESLQFNSGAVRSEFALEFVNKVLTFTGDL